MATELDVLIRYLGDTSGLTAANAQLQQTIKIIEEIEKRGAKLNVAGDPKEIIRLAAEIEKLGRELKKVQQEEEKLQQQRNKTTSQQQRNEQQVAQATANAQRAQLSLQQAQDRAARSAQQASRRIAEQSGLIGQLRSNIARLNSLRMQANTPAQIERINRLLDAQNARMRQLQNAGRQTTNTFGNALDSFQFKFNFLGNLFASVTTGLADSLFQLGSSSVAAFVDAEKNARNLEFALKGNSVAADILIKQSGELQDKGIFSDDDIQRAQTQLITFGLTAKQAEALTPKILDLAAATGKDLGEATDIVLKGINGQTRGLKQLGIDYEDTGDKTENLAILTDKLTKFQGANAAQLDTVAGKTKRLENAFDDLKEGIGEYIVGVSTLVLDSFDQLTGKMSAAERGLKEMNRLFDEQAEAQNNSLLATLKTLPKQEQQNKILDERSKLQAGIVAATRLAAKTDAEVIARDQTLKFLTKRRDLLLEYEKTLNEVQKVQADEDPDAIKAQQDAAEKAQQERQKALDDFRKRQIEGIQDDRLKSFAQNEEKYNTEKKQLDEFLAAKTISQLEYEQQLTAITEIYGNQRQALKDKFAEEDKKASDELDAALEAEIKERDDQAAKEEKDAEDARKAEFDSQNEALKQVQEYLDKRKELNDAAAEEEKQKQTALIEEISDIIGQGTQAYIDAQEKRLESLQQEQSNQQEAVDNQRRLAELGLANTLAFEEQRAAKLKSQEAEEKRRIERAKKFEAYYNLFANYAKEDPKTAALNAFKDIALAEVFARAFAKDGGIVGDIAKPFAGGEVVNGIFRGRSHAQGGIHLEAEGNEGIFSGREMQNLGKENFYDLKSLLKNPINDNVFEQQGQAFSGIVTIQKQSVNIDPLVEKMDQVIRAVEDKPVGSWEFTSLGDFLYTEKSAGKSTTFNFGNIIRPSRRRTI